MYCAFTQKQKETNVETRQSSRVTARGVPTEAYYSLLPKVGGRAVTGVRMEWVCGDEVGAGTIYGVRTGWGQGCSGEMRWKGRGGGQGQGNWVVGDGERYVFSSYISNYSPSKLITYEETIYYGFPDKSDINL